MKWWGETVFKGSGGAEQAILYTLIIVWHCVGKWSKMIKPLYL